MIPAEFDFGPGLRIEQRIDAAESEAITDRWEFGRWMLTHVPKGGKKLPDGFLDGLAAATGKSQTELKYRRMFAEQTHSREALVNALTNHASWHAIVNDALASGNGNRALYTSTTDEWETPQEFFDVVAGEFDFTTDVCALPASAKCEHYFTPEDDGLAQDWTGTCWMNPPYGSEIAAWVKKAHESSDTGAVVVCLVPARVDTGWWWDHCRYAEIRFLRGRLRFGGAETGAPFPSALVVFNGYDPCVKWWEWQ